jgi:hypothetical protein
MAMTIQRNDPYVLSERLAEYFRPYPAKVLAKTIDCTESTAENFRLARSWPCARHWKCIVRAFGRDVLAAVFMPEIDDNLSRLEREAAQLEERLSEIRKRARQASGGLAGLQERYFAPVDRSPLEQDLFASRDHAPPASRARADG